MPQIRCPNCGININLETRRELDYRMIVSVIERGSKSFTDLLKATGLSRKTLSLRLAALCDSGVLVKDGGYRLNGYAHLEKWGKKMALIEGQPIVKPSFFTRRNVLIILMLLVIGGPIAANVSAMLFRSPPPPPPSPEPPYIGTFKAYIKVYNVTDLFAWQAVVYANSSQLILLDAVEGDFLKANASLGTTFVVADEMNSTKNPNILLVGDTRLGMQVQGVSGTGTLAIITFGYKSENYALPKIIFDYSAWETFLWDSNLAYIQKNTLTIETEA